MNFLHLLVSVGGLTVLAGWAFGLDALTYVSIDFVTMKVATAMGFVLAAPMQHPLARPTAAIAIACMMSATFGAGYAGYLMPEVSDVETVSAGVPSLATGLCFLLLTGSAFCQDFEWSNLLPLATIAIAIVTMAGYLFDSSILRFHVPGISSAMAIHTAILFALWSVADWKLSK